MSVRKITPFLWFDDNAEEAMNLYVSLFANSYVEIPGVSFVLDGQPFRAIDGGPHFSFTPAISLFVDCETQAEIDDLWTKLSAGGKPGRCGWLEDRFGLSWQIVPSILGDLLGDDDERRAGNARDAMLAMGKLDIAALRSAFERDD